jgi:hypothetical protein
VLRSPEQRQKAYRSAAAILRPGLPGGNDEQFILLKKAMEILRGPK